jgi:hypothetical protein
LSGPNFTGLNHLILPSYGYKFSMSSSLAEPVAFSVGGIKPVIGETPIQLNAFTNNKINDYYENWIGYFVPRTQTPQDAFGPFINNIFYIQTQNWTMVRDCNGQWISAAGQNNGQPYTLSYGDMVAVKCYADVIDPPMHWSSGGPELEPYEKEDAEYFYFEEKTEYIPVFIDIEGTDLPKEVGLFVDNICKGGAKVIGKLVEVPAYILEGMPENPEIEFRLYYDDKGKDIIPKYETMNIHNGEFVTEKLNFNEKQDYYYVKINTDVEGTPIPKLYLSNYPNPFNPSTRIEYYVPEDSYISIDIFNVKGQRVYSLGDEFKLKGMNQFYWNGNDANGKSIGSGVYFATLNYKGNKITRKMILMK